MFHVKRFTRAAWAPRRLRTCGGDRRQRGRRHALDPRRGAQRAGLRARQLRGQLRRKPADRRRRRRRPARPPPPAGMPECRPAAAADSHHSGPRSAIGSEHAGGSSRSQGNAADQRLKADIPVTQQLEHGPPAPIRPHRNAVRAPVRRDGRPLSAPAPVPPPSPPDARKTPQRVRGRHSPTPAPSRSAADRRCPPAASGGIRRGR